VLLRIVGQSAFQSPFLPCDRRERQRRCNSGPPVAGGLDHFRSTITRIQSGRRRADSRRRRIRNVVVTVEARLHRQQVAQGDGGLARIGVGDGRVAERGRTGSSRVTAPLATAAPTTALTTDLVASAAGAPYRGHSRRNIPPARAAPWKIKHAVTSPKSIEDAATMRLAASAPRSDLATSPTGIPSRRLRGAR